MGHCDRHRGQFGSMSKFKVKGQMIKSASILTKFGTNDPWVTETDTGGSICVDHDTDTRSYHIVDVFLELSYF